MNEKSGGTVPASPGRAVSRVAAERRDGVPPAENRAAAQAEERRSVKERISTTGSTRPAHDKSRSTGQRREGASLSSAAAKQRRSVKERVSTTGNTRPAHDKSRSTGQMREGASLSSAAAKQRRSGKERVSTTGNTRPAHDKSRSTGQMRDGVLPAETRAVQADMLANRLRKRFRHLKKWARRTGTEVFRVYDRDIPEIPLVLDWYGDAVAGALYKRPYEKDDAEERRWIAAMAEVAAEALGIERASVFIKYRERQRGAAQYQRLGDGGLTRVVNEGGLRFRVNLSDYLDTGLFPDRRRLRALVRDESAGKRVLNLFCYTASFSVYAAAGGAAEIDSVDLSNTYLNWGLGNFELNGFCGEPVSPEALWGGGSAKPGQSPRPPAGTDNPRRGGSLPRFRFIRADALAFLKAAAKARRSWDLIILDPPAFSNSKKMRADLDIRRDYPALIRQSLRLLSPGGRLWFSANARQFSLDPEEFSAVEFPALQIGEKTESLRDEDFRDKKIPRCYLFQV